MAEELDSGVGELVFSLIISYFGAMELFYVARHLFHWSFRHPTSGDNNAKSLQLLQEELRDQQAAAEALEAATGTHTMQDGVAYKDGFRIEQAARSQETKVEDETPLADERNKTEEEKPPARDIEQKRKLADGEHEKADEEKARKLAEDRDSESRVQKENEEKLVESEKQREQAQRLRELSDQDNDGWNAQLPKIENQHKDFDESPLAPSITGITEKLLEVERLRSLSIANSLLDDDEEEEENLNVRRLLANEREQEEKQRRIEENARLFLEAEDKLVELQQHMLEATDNTASKVDVCERVPSPRFLNTESLTSNKSSVKNVKTQISQSNSSEQSHGALSKSLVFPDLSDEGSSVEPLSSQKSSFSTQPSEELTAGAEDSEKLLLETDRQDPEGEDNVSHMRYSDEYLRSLDGIKSRQLSGEDGSGRRRAFKKRRSNSSSNSSRESRTSRDEEVKEVQEPRQNAGDLFTPPSDTNEPALKVKPHRSPHKDAKPTEVDSLRSSLVMLDEESTNSSGEQHPEHYKDTEFQNREGEIPLEKTEKKQTIPEAEPIASNLSKASSPEKVTYEENNEAVTVIPRLEDTDTIGTGKYPINNDNNSNLQTAEFAGAVNNTRASSSPRLRRSPRIDEINQYEDHWREKETEVEKSPNVSTLNTPTISIQTPDVAPWRDQYGLLMEGLSDFYDFTASVNPSRSRSTSRQPSPETSLPKNVNNTMDIHETTSIEVLDDTGDSIGEEISKKNMIDLIESTFDMATPIDLNEEHNLNGLLQNVADEPSISRECLPMIQILHEDQNLILPSVEQESQRERSELQSDSPLPITENLEQNLAAIEINIDQNVDILINVVKSDESLTSVPVDEISSLLDDTQGKSHEMLTHDIKVDVNKNKVVSEDNTNLFVESLRAAQRTRSRSRSRSPLPTSDNIERSLESRRLKRIQINDELFEKLAEKTPSPNATSPLPTISIKCTDEDPAKERDVEEDTTESITKLVAQLRIERSMSRSRSRTPALNVVNQKWGEYSNGHKLMAHNDKKFNQRSKTPEKCDDLESNNIIAMERNCRSLSPSRSRSMSPSLDVIIDSASDNDNFNEMETSESENVEELEIVFAAKQRLLDLKALHQLTNACEEVELRVLSPTEMKREIEMQQNQDSPTTSDYERKISEERQDEKEKLTSDSMCSSYKTESIDMGIEYENLRREAAVFQRSLGPSRSVDMPDLTTAKMYAAKRQELQAAILESLTSASQKVTEEQTVENKLGAKPKTFEYDRNFSEEVQITQDLEKEVVSNGFTRSTYIGPSLDIEDMRQRTSEFLRSRSQSRSPLADEQIEALKTIDAVVAKRELQDQLLDQFASSTINFQNFSRNLNTDFLDNERRASDSALMYKPEHVMQYSEDDELDLDPEEYHHFRRFSLAQEQPIEEYPNDDYVCISQIAVRTLTGTRTWLKEDFYCDDLKDSNLNVSSSVEDNICNENIEIDNKQMEAVDNLPEIDSFDVQARENSDVGVGEVDYFADYFDLEQLDEISSNDSDDDKRTVVEIEDEFDEGISDYNERGGPTDESHHDTSECEEAEREADRYANRDANDWNDIENVDEFLDFGIEEGAVGGMSAPYSDPDLLIEQIYNDAVKNRKQSGILRDYESILQENQESSTECIESEFENGTDGNNISGLYANMNTLDESVSQPTQSLLNNERNANSSTRHSTRLRARYGYNPQLQGTFNEQDIEIDLNYKPKREYNWRKNFKLDDETQTDNAYSIQKEETTSDVDEYLLDYDDLKTDYMEMRHCSLGGESITLFSQSPQREQLDKVDEYQQSQQEMQAEDPTPDTLKAISEQSSTTEKVKKRKSKKKTRKSTKIESDIKDEEDSENQMYSRRSSSLHMETDSPRRKSRSRRSSKSSLANEESVGLFSPRNSVAFVDAIVDIAEEFTEVTETVKKKKTSKRKKATEETPRTAETQKEPPHINGMTAATFCDVPIDSVSPSLTIESFQNNLLASVSAADSVCVTPASIASSMSEIITRETSPTTISAPVPNPNTSSVSVVDTFDILKDANFYPLF